MIESNGNQIRVAIYLRVSTDDQAEKFGLTMQKESISALIKSKGRFEDNTEKMVFAGDQYLYVDEGISGTTPLESRPQFSRLMEDILKAPEGKLPFDAVAVYKIDRFARKLSVLVKVIEFFETHKIKMLSANESIDTSTAFGRAVLGIIGVIAELEIETFKQRSSDGRKQAIRQGVFMGESPPFGYIKNPEKTLDILEPEAEVVRNIYRMFIRELMSPQQIADQLTSMQVLSPSASAVLHKKKRGIARKKNKDTFWRDTRILKILSDQVYIGNYFYGKSHKGKRLPREEWKKSDFVYPSIVEKADFAIAQGKLKKSRTTSISTTRAEEGKHIYLLSGLLKCDQCLEDHRSDEMPSWVGEPKKMSQKGELVTAHYYKCGRRNAKKYSNVCNVITLPADQVEQIVVDQVIELLENPEPVINYQNKLKSQTLELEHLKQKRDTYIRLINAIPDKVERLKEQHESEIITIEELKLKIADQEQIKEKNQEELEALEIQINKTILSKEYFEVFKHFQVQYQEALGNLQHNRQFIHEMLDTLLEKVVVKSRPVTSDDIISGRKKDGQYIPHKLDLYFRLPKDLLQEAFFKFGVKNANL